MVDQAPAKPKKQKKDWSNTSTHCPKCGVERNAETFSPKAWICRQCNRDYAKARRKRDKLQASLLGRERKRLQRAKDRIEYHKARADAAVFLNASAPKEDPPPVTPFPDFRGEFLSTTEENPLTLRRQDVGKNYPYMRPFLDALSTDEERRLLCLWPIRHGKTKIVEQFVVWTLCRNPQARIIFVCGSEALAKDRIFAVQQILMDVHRYPELHKRWGQWIGKPTEQGMAWGATEFYVKGRRSTERDPSVRALGASSRILGARADLIILDDVDDPTNGFEDRRTLLRNINTAIRTRLNEGGKVVVIGNRCAPDDIYSHLMDRKGWWVDVQSALDDKGAVLCEEMYSRTELEELAEDMTPEEFSLMVLNNPTPEGGSVFTMDLIQAARGEYRWREIPKDWEVVTGLDPSTAETAACVTVAWNPATRECRVVDLEEKGAPRHDGLVKMLAQALARNHPRTVVIEEQGGSHFFSDVPEVMEMIYDAGARLVRFKTSGSNKHDPAMGISLIASEMLKGRLTYAWGDAKAQSVMRQLVSEMIAWKPHGKGKGGNHFDAVMALWFCVNTIHMGRSAGARSRAIIDRMVSSNPWLRRRVGV